MKTLENQTLLYDADCPLCRAYTTAFVKTGMLDENGKRPFSTFDNGSHDFINFQRASNEIALVNFNKRTVVYGIDSLLTVIGNSFPLVSKIGNLKPIKFLLQKLYSFISYNRKVIIPNTNNDSKTKCIPDFNYKYRIAFVAFATTFTAFILYQYASIVVVFPNGTLWREWVVAFGQIIFQIGFLLKYDAKTRLNYIGNLMTVSLMGSLILVPLLLLNIVVNLPQFVILAWFGVTVGLMFLEHFRRIKLLKLPGYLCFTWVLYRLIVLIIILNL